MFGEYHIAQMQLSSVVQVSTHKWAQDEINKGTVFFDLPSFDAVLLSRCMTARQNKVCVVLLFITLLRAL